VHGPYVDEPLIWFEGAGLTTPRFVHADRQGSVIGWSDVSGSNQAAYAYDPYGQPSSWTGPRFSYTGQISLPQAQLYYYKARVYDPVRGWFLQTDPVGYEEDLNLYRYIHNSPLNGSDPLGLAESGSVTCMLGACGSNTSNASNQSGSGDLHLRGTLPVPRLSGTVT